MSSLIKPEVESMKVPISYDDYVKVCNKFGMNSYERQFVYEKMDDESLCKVVEECMKQVTLYHPDHKIKSTYEEAICMLFAPMLVKRLRERK